MKYYEDVVEGEEVVFEQEYLVTEEEIIEVGTRWDPQPFHIDPIAAKGSFFGGLVASSAHLFSIYCCIGTADYDQNKNVHSVSALGFNNMQWHDPVRPGDKLRSKYVVTASRESVSRPTMGIIVTRSTLFNQNDETVFTVECSSLVKKRESV